MSATSTAPMSRASECPVEWADLPQNKTHRPGSPVSVCEMSRTPNAFCLNSLYNSFHELVTTAEQVLQPIRDSAYLSVTHNSPPNEDTAQTPKRGVELRSPEVNVPFLHSPVTPTFETSNHLKLLTSSGGFSLTSTPKTSASNGTKCTTSIPDLNISFNVNEKSKELDRSSMEELEERTEQGGFEHHIPQSNPLLCLSKLGSSNLSIASNDEILHPDESYLSPAQIAVDTKDLHVNEIPAVRESSVDESLLPSFAERSHASQNEVAGLFNTSGNLITPWKKLPKTASTPVLVLEKDDTRNQLGTPVFSPIIRRSRPKLSSNRGSMGHNTFRFSGCFQCCAQDAVVSLLSGVIQTVENKVKYYIVSVQATSLTIWTEDDVSGWTTELDWRLAPDIHVMKACLLPRSDTVVAVVASGWDKRNLFATLFVYDWSTEDTARFNIPVLEQWNELQSPTQIELCPFLASELHIAVTSDTHHRVGSVLFTDSLRAVQSLSMFGLHRSKLISFVAVKDQVSASVSLTADQEVTIWNMKLGVALKKIKLQPSLPCLTGLLSATSYKGILLLDTVWRVDDGDCGGVIAVNPLTGSTQKIVIFSAPNNTWRSVESAKSETTLVIAISDKGSLCMWDRRTGALLGYTKSKITTCASLTLLSKHLIVGEIHGCLHIYSVSN